MSSVPFLPFALPDISEAEITAVGDALRSGWITTGPRTKEFEQKFATAVGAKHAIALNSCTAALHLALEAVGLGADDEVIVPTLTFAATAEVVRYFGAKPVLVDVRRDDQQIDPAAVARAITSKTRAIIPVHFGGQLCDIDAILELAQGRGVRVIEDAAHSFPATFRGKSVGTFSDVTCFSFYATKTITTGEGGMATTDDDKLAERMRIMALHGISKDAWKRYSAEGSWFYEVVAPGYKYNLTDIASALGLGQLSRAVAMCERRAAIAARYREAFGPLTAFDLPKVHDDRSHAWHLFVLRLNLAALRIDRARFIEELKTLGIGTSVHFIPLHLHPYYRDTYGHRPDAFPNAAWIYERSISLPIYSKMSDADVSRVIAAVQQIAAANAR